MFNFCIEILKQKGFKILFWIPLTTFLKITDKTTKSFARTFMSFIRKKEGTILLFLLYFYYLTRSKRNEFVFMRYFCISVYLKCVRFKYL